MCNQYPYVTLWYHLSGFADVFDVDYFIKRVNGFIRVVKDLPSEIASKEPFHVDCSKRKGQFDYIESVLPFLLEHHYISITPAMSQRRDRYFNSFLLFFLLGVLRLLITVNEYPTSLWRSVASSSLQ